MLIEVQAVGQVEFLDELRLAVLLEPVHGLVRDEVEVLAAGRVKHILDIAVVDASDYSILVVDRLQVGTNLFDSAADLDRALLDFNRFDLISVEQSTVGRLAVISALVAQLEAVASQVYIFLLLLSIN